MLRHGVLALVVAYGSSAAPAGAQVPSACYGDDAAAVACIVNEGRKAMGLRRLRPHPILTGAAERYAVRMTREGFFSHRDPEGRGPVDRMVSAGYGERRTGRRWRVGEVLGAGLAPGFRPAGVVFQWLASPEHRHVLLNRRHRHVGVGIAEEPGGLGALPLRRYVLYAGRRMTSP